MGDILKRINITSINIDIIVTLDYNYRCYEVTYMKKSVNVLPSTEEILVIMGEQIKLARLRRQLSVKLVAERLFIPRTQEIRGNIQLSLF